MELSREVRFSLPRHVNVNRISYHVKLPSGLNSPMGETHLLNHNGRLVVLTRNNSADSLVPVGLSPKKQPELLHEEWQDILFMRGDAKQRFRVPLPNSLVGPVAFILEETKAQPPETVDGAPDPTEDAAPSDAEGTTDEPGAEALAFPLFDEADPTPDLDIDPMDPESVLDAVGAHLRARRVELAATWARTIPEMSLFHTPEAHEALGVIEALANDEPEEAFLRAELADFLRVKIHDGAMRPIADTFAHRGEAAWAAAALSSAIEAVDDVALTRAFRQLGKDAARDEHHDWLLTEIEGKRTELISQKIVETRSAPLWRELRARLAGRRGGHALALRELKVLSERCPGSARIESARLRAMWDSHQRPLFDRLLERCQSDFGDDATALMHITRVARDLGGSPDQILPFIRRLAELAPGDPIVSRWASQLRGGSDGSGVWVAVGLGGVALAAAIMILF